MRIPAHSSPAPEDVCVDRSTKESVCAAVPPSPTGRSGGLDVDGMTPGPRSARRGRSFERRRGRRSSTCPRPMASEWTDGRSPPPGRPLSASSAPATDGRPSDVAEASILRFPGSRSRLDIRNALSSFSRRREPAGRRASYGPEFFDRQSLVEREVTHTSAAGRVADRRAFLTEAAVKISTIDRFRGLPGPSGGPSRAPPAKGSKNSSNLPSRRARLRPPASTHCLSGCPPPACPHCDAVRVAIGLEVAIIPSHVGTQSVVPSPRQGRRQTATSARKPEKGRGGVEPVDCNALEATTSIEDITGNEHNRDILRWLQNDELSQLWLCRPELSEDNEDYGLGSSRELDWLGHFVKKSTRLEGVGISGDDTFVNCSGHSVDRFLDDLGKCNHIKKMIFAGTNLAEIICKLDGAMESNNFTHFVVKECHLGVPEATFLFNTFRVANSLEELHIHSHSEEDDPANLNDGDMAGCIPSLAACSGMRSLTLNYLNLSTNSCAALRGVFPRMAALRKVVLHGNSLDDDCTTLLARGLSDCKQIQSLDLSDNRISDNGLDVLVQRLPASVEVLHMTWNDITLARHVRLLRLRVFNIEGNTLCPGGTGVIAASLANTECRLEDLHLYNCNIGDKGAATLAEGLRNNQRLTVMSLGGNNITERGLNPFLSILCDTSSINATYNSNHTLRSLGGYGVQIPQDVEVMLRLNKDKNKSRVATNKILRTHRHLDTRPLFGWELGLLPYVVAWLEHFAKSRPDLKLSSMFEFVRAMPMKVTDGAVGNATGKKRKLYS
ncbi:hypothetical protein THAOC_35884 [Thalassiosira oceanica]|uniref:Uncharacterized protein n=1 Tax=Thalassiosira oceanica TaxID=159749 RepID=K0R2P7_THAOC|nr:hypothetical protein THAOC_35884 [Thalassiosira oceanica]|eukprot:EJK45499.1 hypothetical protein THAOC_35884 [Thalassiosira oceanica]